MLMIMTTGRSEIQQNHILASLPAKERKMVREHLELVSLRQKEELNELDSLCGTCISRLGVPLV